MQSNKGQYNSYFHSTQLGGNIRKSQDTGEFLPDIVRILPERSDVKTNSLYSESQIIINNLYKTVIKDDCFEEPWNVEDNTEDDDWGNKFKDPEADGL